MKKESEIRVGSVGLGRLGYKHAENLCYRIPNVKLVSVCDIDEDKLDEVSEKWKLESTFTDFKEMIDDANLDAMVIVSPSSLHCEQIEYALNKKIHVFCEKPFGTTIEECKIAEKAVETNPDVVFMLGFMRRYDPSYQYAKKMIDGGKIGLPILFRGYSVDPESAIDGAINYAPHSSGQFLDMAIHDIDLARWYINFEPKEVYAIGGCYLHPEFEDYEDGDNVGALMKFENGTMAFLYAGRTAPHGYNVETEIIGTKATLRIGSVPQANLVEVIDTTGVRKECSQDFIERFDTAYINELNEFAACIRENRKPEITVKDGTKATEIALAATESFRKSKLILI